MIEKSWADFNDLYEGRTIFIIGAGPSLCDLTKPMRKALGAKPSIGLNAVPYIVSTRIFLSAYMAMCLVMKRRYNDLKDHEAKVVNMKLGRVTHPHHDGVIRIQRQRYKRGLGIHRRFGSCGPILFTQQNSALAATHLAYIMGAARIVYVGVELKSQLHFYHIDLARNYRIWEDVCAMSRKSSRFGKTLARLRNQFDPMRAQECRIFAGDRPYLSNEGMASAIRETFVDYFKIMADQVKFYSTDPGSVPIEAGASPRNIEEVLQWT